MLDFHPFVVHFAIGLLCTSVLLDVLSFMTERQYLQMPAWWNLFFGFLAILFAVFTGLYAKTNGYVPESAESLVTYHQYFGMAGAVLFTVLFIWRANWRNTIPSDKAPTYLIVAILGTIMVLITGFLGGQLVFQHGVNVRPLLGM